MKKIFLAAILLFSVAQFSYAQFEIRPFVGVTSSSLENFGNVVTFKDKAGFSFGVDLMIGNRLYVQPGFHYEGVHNKVEAPSLNEQADLKIKRVRIPVLIGFKLLNPDNNRVFNVRLFTGPNASFVTNVDDGGSQLEISKDDFKNIVFGWNAGAGLDILFLFVDVGYQFGLSEIFEDLNIQGLEGENSKNNVIYANAGVRIRF